MSRSGRDNQGLPTGKVRHRLSKKTIVEGSSSSERASAKATGDGKLEKKASEVALLSSASQTPVSKAASKMSTVNSSASVTPKAPPKASRLPTFKTAQANSVKKRQQQQQQDLPPPPPNSVDKKKANTSLSAKVALHSKSNVGSGVHSHPLTKTQQQEKEETPQLQSPVPVQVPVQASEILVSSVTPPSSSSSHATAAAAAAPCNNPFGPPSPAGSDTGGHESFFLAVSPDGPSDPPPSVAPPYSIYGRKKPRTAAAAEVATAAAAAAAETVAAPAVVELEKDLTFRGESSDENLIPHPTILRRDPCEVISMPGVDGVDGGKDEDNTPQDRFDESVVDDSGDIQGGTTQQQPPGLSSKKTARRPSGKKKRSRVSELVYRVKSHHKERREKTWCFWCCALPCDICGATSASGEARIDGSITICFAVDANDRQAVIRHLASGHVYGYPNTNGGFFSNLLAFFYNEHPLLSLFLSHKLHPLTRNRRIVILCCTVIFAFFMTSFMYEQNVWPQMRRCNHGCDNIFERNGVEYCGKGSGDNKGYRVSDFDKDCDVIPPWLCTFIISCFVVPYGYLLRFVAMCGCIQGFDWENKCWAFKTTIERVGSNILAYFVLASVAQIGLGIYWMEANVGPGHALTVLFDFCMVEVFHLADWFVLSTIYFSGAFFIEREAFLVANNGEEKELEQRMKSQKELEAYIESADNDVV